jgi:hypothetical protein
MIHGYKLIYFVGQIMSHHNFPLLVEEDAHPSIINEDE